MESCLSSTKFYHPGATEPGNRRNFNFRNTTSGNLAGSLTARFLPGCPIIPGADQSDDFLSWKSLRILGIKGDNQPLSLKIDEIALNDPQTNFVVAPDGTLNLQAMVKTASGEEVSTKTAETNKTSADRS